LGNTGTYGRGRKKENGERRGLVEQGGGQTPETRAAKKKPQTAQKENWPTSEKKKKNHLKTEKKKGRGPVIKKDPQRKDITLSRTVANWDLSNMGKKSRMTPRKFEKRLHIRDKGETGKNKPWREGHKVIRGGREAWLKKEAETPT